MCIVVYRRLEGISWQDALFWMIQPHAIDPNRVRNATKLFSIFVYAGVFAFQIWVAERVAVTIFKRQGVEAWRTMVNDVSIEKIRDHFIICGYGQVGRTVVDQLNRLKIPFVLIETNEGLSRELLKDKVLIIHGDAKRHDVLQSAGIERARGVCIVIHNDAYNLYITVTAKALNPKFPTTTRTAQTPYT